MTKKTYTVLYAVVHNDKRYEKDEPIDLEDKFAEPLLATNPPAIAAPAAAADAKK